MKADWLLIFLIALTTLAACSQGAATSPAAPTAAGVETTIPAPTTAPTSAAQPTTAPAPTTGSGQAAEPTTAQTAAPATQAPSGGSTLPGGDLSEADMEKIFQASFAAYPWRMKLTTTDKSNRQTVTGLVEAQSSTRVHILTQQALGSNTVIIESILITPTLYMKATGAPPEVLQLFGATEGQWINVPAGSPAAGFAQLAYLAANPAKLLGNLGFQDLMKRANPNEKPFKQVGTETVGSTSTNVYELDVGSGNSAITYRVSVGGDGRIYKMVSDGAQHTATTLVEYDPSINIQPPIQ